MRTGYFIMDVGLPDIHTVSFSALPDHFCRNTTSNAVCRYVTGDNCACCNDAVFSNRNTAADRDAGADPTAVLQRDRRCIFKIVPAVRIVCVQPFFSKKRMLRRCQSYIGADPDTVAQYNGADIKKRAVIIYKAIFSYMDIDTDSQKNGAKTERLFPFAEGISVSSAFCFAFLRHSAIRLNRSQRRSLRVCGTSMSLLEGL